MPWRAAPRERRVGGLSRVISWRAAGPNATWRQAKGPLARRFLRRQTAPIEERRLVQDRVLLPASPAALRRPYPGVARRALCPRDATHPSSDSARLSCQSCIFVNGAAWHEVGAQVAHDPDGPTDEQEDDEPSEAE